MTRRSDLKETLRADAYLQMLRNVGLTDVEQDPEGNVFGIRKGTGKGPMLAVVAHLDTVFPEGTQGMDELCNLDKDPYKERTSLTFRRA